MKILLIAVLVLAAATAAPAQSTDRTTVPTIKVTGSAEINVVPDEVNISFKASSVAKELAAAKKATDEQVVKILAISKRFGIAAADIKTDYISVDEKYERRLLPGTDDEYENVFAGYSVSRTISVKLRDITKFEELLTEAINAELSSISNVSFGTSELRKHKDHARANAIKAARQKADAAAAEIGQSIGKAVHIVENDIDGYRSPYANFQSNTFALDGEEIGGSAIGTIAVKAQFEVEFILR